MWRMWGRAATMSFAPKTVSLARKRPSSSGVMRGARACCPCATITLTIPRVTSVLTRFALTRCGGWKTMKLRRGTTSAPKIRSTIQEICSAMLRYAYLVEDASERSIAGAHTFGRGYQVGNPFEAFFPRRGESCPRLGLRARDCHQSGSGRPEGELYARKDDGHAASAR